MARLATDGFAVPVDWTWTGIMTSLADACDQLRDPSAAVTLYDRLHPVADQLLVVGNLVICESSLHFWCGELAACLGRWNEAEHHFESAFAMNESLGARPWIVRTRRAWATMFLDRNAPGDRKRAAELIAAGRAEAEALGMARELVRFQRLSARLDA